MLQDSETEVICLSTKELQQNKIITKPYSCSENKMIFSTFHTRAQMNLIMAPKQGLQIT
uniref:Uncharacterized protein n=1 Tax=Rhizophora mucronata TaxID=61149 RepID=A0A2P2NTS6_RHIMU